MSTGNVNLEIIVITSVIWGRQVSQLLLRSLLWNVVDSVGKHPPLMRKTPLISSHLLTTSSIHTCQESEGKKWCASLCLNMHM